MPETVESSQEQPAVAQKRRYRRFVARDITDVATLMAEGNTESESCRLLGINPDSFRDFKADASRNTRFVAEFELARGKLVHHCVQTMKEAGDTINPKTGLKDWRAHQAVLQTVVRDRFGQQQAPAVNVSVYGSVGHIDIGARVYARRRAAEQKALTVASEVKQLPACGVDTPTGSGDAA